MPRFLQSMVIDIITITAGVYMLVHKLSRATYYESGVVIS